MSVSKQGNTACRVSFLFQNHPERYENLICFFILTLLTPTKNSLARAEFELAPSGFSTAALTIELSSQRGLVIKG